MVSSFCSAFLRAISAGIISSFANSKSEKLESLELKYSGNAGTSAFVFAVIRAHKKHSILSKLFKVSRQLFDGAENGRVVLLRKPAFVSGFFSCVGCPSRGASNMCKFMNDCCRDHPLICIVQTPGRYANIFVVTVCGAVESSVK